MTTTACKVLSNLHNVINFELNRCDARDFGLLYDFLTDIQARLEDRKGKLSETEDWEPEPSSTLND